MNGGIVWEEKPVGAQNETIFAKMTDLTGFDARHDELYFYTITTNQQQESSLYLGLKQMCALILKKKKSTKNSQLN